MTVAGISYDRFCKDSGTYYHDKVLKNMNMFNNMKNHR